MAKKTKEAEESFVSTKEVADELGVDPKFLRAVIRDSGIFDDQRNQRYKFTGLDDPKVDQIREAIEDRKARKKSTKKDESAEKSSKKKKSKKGKKGSKKRRRDSEASSE